MALFLSSRLVALVTVTLALVSSGGHLGAQATSTPAPAVVSNGTISLGVNPAGNLVFGGTGVRLQSQEAVDVACKCEGWGIAYDGTQSAHANLSEADLEHPAGVFNMTIEQGQALLDGQRYTSVVTTGGKLRITHEFAPSLHVNVYEALITIQNISTTDDATNIRYRRVVDWDVPASPHNEQMEFHVLGAAKLHEASNDGFQSASPFNTTKPRVPAVDGIQGILGTADATGDQVGLPDTTTVFRLQAAPTFTLTNASADTVTPAADQGALFDFDFGTLAPGRKVQFRLRYGAANSREAALNALANADTEVYALARPAQDNGTVFAVGFDEVGGTNISGSEACGDGVDNDLDSAIDEDCVIQSDQGAQTFPVGNNVTRTFTFTYRNARASTVDLTIRNVLQQFSVDMQATTKILAVEATRLQANFLGAQPFPIEQVNDNALRLTVVPGAAGANLPEPGVHFAASTPTTKAVGIQIAFHTNEWLDPDDPFVDPIMAQAFHTQVEPGVDNYDYDALVDFYTSSCNCMGVGSSDATSDFLMAKRPREFAATFSGFLSPHVDFATVKAGQAYPIKFTLTNQNGVLVTPLQLSRVPKISIAKRTQVGSEYVYTRLPLAATGGSDNSGSPFRFDAATGQWVFNWDSKVNVGLGEYVFVMRSTVTTPKRGIVKLK